MQNKSIILLGSDWSATNIIEELLFDFILGTHLLVKSSENRH